MRLLLASEEHSSQIKEFFERMHLPGAIDFSIRRHGSFFDQYRLLSDDFETALLMDENNQISGMASLIFREGWVLGEKQIWGYATDLRIAPNRKAITQWSQHFLPVLEKACAARNCRFVFSAVEQHENQAYNALIRPTSHGRRKLPRYHLVNRFRVVTLHGRKPFSTRSLPSIQLEPLEIKHLDRLCTYLRERAASRPLADRHTPERFLARLQRWPGLELKDIRIATDRSGRVLGCAGLWNSSHVQQFIPQTYHGTAHTLHQSLWLASLVGLARPTPPPEKPMPLRFLTHLACDNAEVFHRLVDDAFDRLGPKEILSYGHFKGHWRTLPPESFIASSIPFGLYMVMAPHAKVPDWPTPGMHALPPEFEMAWL